MKDRATPQKKLVRNPKTRQWEYKTVRIKNAFGETNYDDKTIRINKAMSHKAAQTKKGVYKKFGMPKKDTTIINSLVHETLHKNRPKLKEKTVRKLARTQTARMSKKRKAKLRSKLR